MEFMVLFIERDGAPPPEPEAADAMRRYAVELRSRGVIRRAGRLAPPAEAATARVRDGKALVVDGPFAETKEQVAGFWILEAADRAAAIEIARRAPYLGRCAIQVHALARRWSAPDSEKGLAFLLAFRMSDALRSPDPAKMREMVEFGTALHGDGTLFETAPLTGDPPPARLETKRGKVLVTDGPFAESKEGIGGYSLVRVPERAGAIELAKRYPHAKWGPVEVREVELFDRV